MDAFSSFIALSAPSSVINTRVVGRRSARDMLRNADHLFPMQPRFQAHVVTTIVFSANGETMQKCTVNRITLTFC